MRHRFVYLSLFIGSTSCALYACGSDGEGSGPEDAGIVDAADAGHRDGAGGDTGTDARDERAIDAPVDTGADPEDAARDADGQAGDGDAAGDAGPDAPWDAPVDASDDSDDGSDAADGAPEDSGDAGDADLSDASDAGSARTVFVVRVGEGADGGPLAWDSLPVFLEERTVTDGTLLRTIALPTVADGDNRPLTLTGADNTMVGALSRSADGRYVTLAGFATGPGFALVESSVVPRVAARVDSAGNVDTTTDLGKAYSTKSPMAATTIDGTGFWCAGGKSNGVQYVPFNSGADGGKGSPVQILASAITVDSLGIFGGELYAGGNLGVDSVYRVGAGAPKTSGQLVTATRPTTATDVVFDFVLFDRDPLVAGVDTLYVAKFSSTAAGIEKWGYDGTTWSLVTTFTNDLPTNGVRHLTGYEDGGNVVLVATTRDVPSKLLSYVDDGTSPNPTPTELATAEANTGFRGVALAPKP